MIQIVRQYSLHYGDFSPAVTIPPTDNGEQPLRIVLLYGNQSHSSMVRNALGEAGEPTQMHSDPDRVGLSMIKNTLREAGVPTQIHSDVD